MNYSSKGFTLAEVLVTLAIIGIVASLTIPNLIKNYQKQQWITSYKSTFSSVKQATDMIMLNNNNTLVGSWGGEGDDAGMYNAYLPYLKVVKACENQEPKGNCFASSYTMLDPAANYGGPGGDYSVILANGASLSFYSDDGANTFNSENAIFIDTNGMKKPNVYGKDMHKIMVWTNNSPVTPEVFGPDTWIPMLCPDDLKSGVGMTCGMRILRGDYGKDY